MLPQRWLGRYNNLFAVPCVVCGLILENGGKSTFYVPPLLRVMDSSGKWRAYHASCIDQWCIIKTRSMLVEPRIRTRPNQVFFCFFFFFKYVQLSVSSSQSSIKTKCQNVYAQYRSVSTAGSCHSLAKTSSKRQRLVSERIENKVILGRLGGPELSAARFLLECCSTGHSSHLVKEQVKTLIGVIHQSHSSSPAIDFPPKIRRCCSGGIPSRSSTRSFIFYPQKLK